MLTIKLSKNSKHETLGWEFLWLLGLLLVMEINLQGSKQSLKSIMKQEGISPRRINEKGMRHR
jgi:hypothetical protein